MKRAFSLIEVLVSVAIIALLAAVLLPSLVQAREQARRAACLGNLRQIGLATQMYLDQNRDYFWRYYVKSISPRGLKWWFGFEPGGPGSGENRPLDKKKGILAPQLRSTDDGLQCPSFPYTDGRYYTKFVANSASYGYNLLLGPANPSLPTRRRADFKNRTSAVFIFTDGIHFDFNPGFNEGHYIEYVDDPTTTPGGFGHFRHNRRANVLFIDAHADGQLFRGPAYPADIPAGPAGNLSSPAGGNSIYGY